MKRSLNRAALLKSLLALAMLGGGACLWRQFSLGRSTKALYDYAEQCAEKKDYPAAADQFARYVQLCPGDPAARVRLAETYDLAYARLGRAQRAIELYHEALGVAEDEQKAAIRLRLGELLLQSQAYIPAADEAEAILKEDPQNTQAASLQAKSVYGQARLGIFKGKPSEVGAGFESALARDPADRDTAMTLARIFREEPQYLGEAARAQRVSEREMEADRIIDRLVAAHPERPEVHLARYQYRMQYHLPGAGDDLKEARRLGPRNLDVLLASADAFRREATEAAAVDGPAGRAADKVRSLREAARDGYDKAVEIAPQDYRGYCGLGETQWELGQWHSAIDSWQRGQKSTPAATSLFDLLLAGGLVNLGRLDEAEKHLDRLQGQFDKLDAAQFPLEKAVLLRKYQLIRAHWLRGKDRPFQAIALARAVAMGAATTAEETAMALEAWSLLADICLSLGRGAEAADAFEKALEIAPKSTRFRVRAAEAWMAANQPDRAIRELRLALAPGETAELRLALAAATLRRNVMAAKGDRDWQAVQAALDDARAAHAKQPLPESWRLALLEAEIVRARADAEGHPADGIRQAAAIYRNIKLDAKAQGTVLPSIALAFERLGLRDEADRTLAAWEKSAPPLQSRMLRARVAAGRKQYDEARRLLPADLDKLSAAQRSAVQRFLVELSLAQRDWQKARAELDALADLGPRDMDLLCAYAELAGQQQQPAEVERCAQKFLEMEGPEGRYVQFLRAGDVLAHADSAGGPQLRDAREMIDRLVRQYPEWPAGLLLRARLLEIEGRGDEAVNAYREAIRHGAASAEPYERLIDLLSRAGRNAEAEAYLDALRQRSFAAEGVAALEAQWTARRGDWDKALDILRGGVKQYPQDAAMQFSLGQVLVASGKSLEASVAFQRAVDIAPDNLLQLRALTLCWIEARQPERARQLLAQLAGRKDLPEIQKQLVIAEVDEALGEVQAARQHYQAACDVPPFDPAIRLRMAEFLLRSPRKEDTADGETLLRAIIAQRSNYAPARRALATMLVQRGGERPWNEARELLHSAPGTAGFSLVDRRLDALFLIRRGGTANRRQAGQILGELVLGPEVDVNDRMLLAKFKDEEGCPEEARAQYVIVVSRKDPSADQLAAYADFLLRQGPLEEADVQIRRLEKLAADDPGCLALRVRCLHAQHRDSEIGPLVEVAAQRRQQAAAASPAEKARHCMTVGALYESCEQYAAAERWYRRLLEAQGDSFEPLATVLARQKRGSEAVRVCLDAATRAPSRRPALAVCALRATGQITAEDFRAAEPLVAAAEKETPEPRFLAMLAAVRILQDRIEDATALYRRALAAEPKNISTLNNLATLLGEQPGHGKEALECIDRAVDLAGPQRYLLETKGAILLREGRVEEAITLLRDSLSAAEPDPRVLLHLAQAYRMAGKLDPARKAFDDAQIRNLPRQLLTPADHKLVKELKEKLGN